MKFIQKKFFNFRPLFCVFIALFSGIILSRYFLLSNYVYWGAFLVILFGALVLCILKKKVKHFLVFLLAFVCGFLFYTVEMKTYSPSQMAANAEEFVGRVAGQSQIKGNYQCVVVDNVSINGEKQSYNVLIVNHNTQNLFSVGDVISGSAKLEKFDLFEKYDDEEHFNSSNYRNNIRYTFSSTPNNFEVIDKDLHFDENLQLSVKSQLDKFMTEENSAISYAMFFGDKSEISYQTKDAFSKSGISHILAISGLHVGVLVGLLMFIFKKCKMNKYISFGIITAFLFVYCLLCSFSPSVVRASVMAVVLMVSNLLGRKYDSLSSIGFAGILLLLFKPLYAFDVGFQMSFACVIGISIFYSSIYNLLRKIKFPNFLASSLAVSISTQIALIPILSNTFGTFSILSVFLNIFVVPIFSVAYIIQFVFLPLTYITSFFGNFLYFTQLILEAIKICATFVATIPYTFVNVSIVNLPIFAGYYTICYAGSKMTFFKRNIKLILCLSLLLITIIFAGILYIL